ncbi:MAG: hypothetical protein DLM70_11470 [Chloroflexi bacterium]|nr:MAG: hypothetical protein DLM70_11470 [Chloroflexota bacterium]
MLSHLTIIQREVVQEDLSQMTFHLIQRCQSDGCAVGPSLASNQPAYQSVKITVCQLEHARGPEKCYVPGLITLQSIRQLHAQGFDPAKIYRPLHS